ncbi:ExbD/TolR family protein [Adhaeretor mobilis]|uniref:Biopolymer transport protein ExbD n=1 Tax=Adhaeretor mobilis TaxID=1930276 RepID=A0A517N1R5_9BACT|nr:biopolymer transporter ExbD [Adhaeretor mobilis]QDT01076.1 biopolymer transport protein ExbD [Adhaeretor mobilis]
MRKPSLGRDRAIDFNVTPMIDVVFLLIIFFLVSSHLASQETLMDLLLPSAESKLESAEAQQHRITINVTAVGETYLGGRAASVAEISKRLAVERKITAEELQVRIRADRHVPYGKVTPLLAACVQAQVLNVAFAVEEDSP